MERRPKVPAAGAKARAGGDPPDARSDCRAWVEAVVEAMGEGLLVVGPGGEVLHANPAWLELHGLPSLDAYRRRAAALAERLELVDERGKGLPTADWPLPRALRGEPFTGFDAIVRRSDTGEARFVLYGGRPVRDAAGRTVGTVITCRDVTAERRKQREAEQTTERLRWILGSITDGYMALDEEWRFTGLNPIMERLFGQRLVALRGRVLWEEFPQALDSECGALLQSAARERRPVHAEVPNPIQPGWLEVHAYPRPGGLEVFVRNISDRKRADAALRAANDTLEQRVAERTRESEERAARLAALSRQLSEVEQRERARIAQVLHDDLQQVLVAARMQVGVLGRQSAAGQDISGLSRQTEHLIEEAIDTSRSLSHELSPAVLRDQGLIAALSWLSRRFGENHGLCVTPVLEEGAEPQDDAVRVLLYEVAREFLLNVVKHSGVREADLRLQVREGRVRLEVEDRGRGFDPDAPLRRLAGFGLLQVRERVEFLGGRLDVWSRPGAGVSVAVVLPRALAATEESREARVPNGSAVRGVPASGGIRVLLADDHRMVRTGLVMALRLEPDIHVVAEAADGRSAVQLTEALHPDVVVMDVSMPVMGGAEATRRIRASAPQTRVVALSMHDSAEIQQVMIDAGAAAYLSKNGPPEALAAAIRKARNG